MKKVKLIRNSISMIIFSAAIFSIAYNSSIKIANADSTKISDIQHQAIILRDLRYSPREVKKIIKMTNKDCNFYIEDYSDNVVIAKQCADPDKLEDITVIDFNN